jgi:hypothetical protein
VSSKVSFATKSCSLSINYPSERSLSGEWHVACFLKSGPAGRRDFCGWFMAGIGQIRIVSLLLLASCTALCQHSDTPRTHSDTSGAAISLPDAPSIQSTSTRSSSTQVPAKAEIFRAYENAAHSPATEPVGITGNRTLLSDLEYQEKPSEKESSKFLEKYLSPAAVKRSRSFHPSTDGSLMGRASYAASSTLVKRDDTGRKRPNTSYLLSVLTSAAADTANRPYWRRSVSQPFSDLGSTIGNDAGINLFHEFEPGIRGLVKSHEPRFISTIESKIEDRIRNR